MRVAIISPLARASGLSDEEVSEAFAKARDAALDRNGGRDDTRTFVLTFEAFRQAHPFTLDALQAAKEDGDGPNGKASA